MPKGVDIAASAVADSLVDLAGGLRRGGTVLAKADLAVTLDGTAWDLEGFTAFFDMEQTSGGDFSGTYAGDAQGVSNIDGLPGFSLYQAYVEKIWTDVAAVKAGIVDLNTEFDVQDVGVLFLNGSFGIGPDFSQSGIMGPSVFPAVGLGARASAQIGGVTVKAGVFDALPRNPAHPHALDLSWSARDGSIVVGEAQWSLEGMRWKIGGWFYTASEDEVGPAAIKRYGNRGLYGSVAARLYGDADGGGPALDGWIRAGMSRETFDPVAGFVGGGLVFTGPFAERATDQIGLAVASAFFGSPTRQASSPALSASETAIELTYAAPVTGWLVVQPDVQYVVTPGGSGANALVGGVRLSLSLSPDGLL